MSVVEYITMIQIWQHIWIHSNSSRLDYCTNSHTFRVADVEEEEEEEYEDTEEEAGEGDEEGKGEAEGEWGGQGEGHD